MDLETIKQRLIETGEFENNTYLYQYCKLIEERSQEEYNPSKMNRHHILPRSYFKYNNLEVDDSDSNIAVLLFKDHILAHYLLYRASNSLQKYCNAHAVIHLVRQKHLTVENLLDEFQQIDLEDCQKLYEDFKSGLHNILVEKCGGSLNGNCKYKDLFVFDEVKRLLDTSELSYDEISIVTELPKDIISAIATGKHWSCIEDNFVSKKVQNHRNAVQYHRQHKDEIEQKKIQRKQKQLQKKLDEEQEYQEWLAEPRFCKHCGKQMTQYYISEKYGKGIFCSSKCVYSYVASLRDPEYYKVAMEHRRSFSGENNPNYGKKASEELRRKLSEIYRNSEGVKNSPRFTGKKHTEETKKKISESLKARYEK